MNTEENIYNRAECYEFYVEGKKTQIKGEGDVGMLSACFETRYSFLF